MADMGEEEEEEEELLLSHGFGSSIIVLETPRLLTPRLPLETEAEPPVPISALRALQARGRSSLVCWQPADIHKGAHECTEAVAADRVPVLPACPPPPPPPARLPQASHFLSTWGQRGWEFAVGLIMLELHPSSLALVALWGLLDAALSVLCGAAIGGWVDRQPRLVAASRMYLLQNSMVALSAATALALLWSSAREGALYWAGLALTMGAGAVSTLGAMGGALSGERLLAVQGMGECRGLLHAAFCSPVLPL